MSRTGDHADEYVRERVLKNLWKYIDENFHKMTEQNKLKVVIALCTKNVPQIVEGTYTSTTKMEVVKIDDKPLEFKIGNNRITSDPQRSN